MEWISLRLNFRRNVINMFHFAELSLPSFPEVHSFPFPHLSINHIIPAHVMRGNIYNLQKKKS